MPELILILAALTLGTAVSGLLIHPLMKLAVYLQEGR